jgi:hypothetical protein
VAFVGQGDAQGHDLLEYLLIEAEAIVPKNSETPLETPEEALNYRPIRVDSQGLLRGPGGGTGGRLGMALSQ